ncbi:MAG: flippase [Neisseriaceae bacterium]|nr:flippase [Neisseriaceae bacterium]
MASLKRNIVALFFMQGINYLVPLLTLPYLTRTLGVYEYGAMNIGLSIIQYAILLTNFGFNLSTTKKISLNRHSPQKINEIFWETIYSKSLLALVSLFAMTLVIIQIDTVYEVRWIILALSIQVIAAIITPDWFFQGLEKVSQVSIITSCCKLFTIPLLFWMVRSPADVVLASAIQSATILLAAILALYLVSKENIIKKAKINIHGIKNALYESLPLFIGTLAISVYNASTPLILGLVNTFEEVGYYSASFRIRGALTGLFLVLGQVFYPRASKLFADNPTEGYLFVRKLIFYLFPFAVLGSIFFYYIVPMLAPLVLGEEFSHTQTILKTMAPMIILTPYAVIFANYLLLPLGYKKPYFIMPIVTAILHIPYTILLSSKYGAIGAGYSILITEIISCLGLFIICLKLTDIKKYLKPSRAIHVK